MDIDVAQCSLTELVEDPLISLMMRSDGVDRRSIELLFARVSRERAQAARQSHLPAFSLHLPVVEAAPCPSC